MHSSSSEGINTKNTKKSKNLFEKLLWNRIIIGRGKTAKYLLLVSRMSFEFMKFLGSPDSFVLAPSTLLICIACL